MASKDTVSIVYEVLRSRGAGSQSEVATSRTMPDVENFKKVEIKLAAGETGRAVSLAEVGGSAKMIHLVTPRKVTVKVNGDAGKPYGSVYFAMDTEVTSCVLDNNLLNPPEEFRVEVWLAS